MRIKEIIKEKGLTINELAEKLEVSRQALGKQIKGKMLVETADKIASALGVPTWQLFVSPEEVSVSELVADNKSNTNTLVCPHCGKTLNISIDVS